MIVLTVCFYSMVSFITLISGCSSSDKSAVTLNGYTFPTDSATLTNHYFPGSAVDGICFTGYDSWTDSSYVWLFTEGEIIQGVETLHAQMVLMNSDGTDSIVFDSMLAQDINGNVHVLKNGETLSGFAAGSAATLLMPGDPKVGDSFGPSADYIGTVLSLDETVGSYTGVLHTQFIVTQADGTKNQYDDYWAPGVGQVKSIWSLADGTTGYWLREYPNFRTLQNDVQACMEPGTAGASARIAFSEKYNVPLDELEILGDPNASNRCEGWCYVEEATVVGHFIWWASGRADGWIFSDDPRVYPWEGCGYAIDYCLKYSEFCDHWHWTKGCLKPLCNCPKCWW